MEQLVTIELFGQKFTFKSESEAVDSKEVVSFLTREVGKVNEQLKQQHTHISNLTILLLAVLNIVNEHLELKRKYSILLETLSNRSETLIQLLDNRVGSKQSSMVQVDIS
ncbi:MAG: cell division protein ZapA [Thermodesulfobacteriota bacterium]